MNIPLPYFSPHLLLKKNGDTYLHLADDISRKQAEIYLDLSW